MALDAPKLEYVVNENGLEVYQKVWEAWASQISIAMPQTFRVGYFLEYLSLRQDRAVELLQNLCTNVAVYSTWADEGLCTTKLHVV